VICVRIGREEEAALKESITSESVFLTEYISGPLVSHASALGKWRRRFKPRGKGPSVGLCLDSLQIALDCEPP
jgi:hypothetical protein